MHWALCESWYTALTVFAGWHGTSNSDICEGLEDWTTDLSNLSESDEDEVASLLVSLSSECSLPSLVGDLMFSLGYKMQNTHFQGTLNVPKN